MNFTKGINDSIEQTQKTMNMLDKHLQTVEEYELDDLLSSFEVNCSYASNWSDSLQIEASSFEQAGEIARALLPAVGRFNKSFCSYTGKIELEGTLPNGTTINITSPTSEACQLVVVEEKKWIPAHEEVRTSYRLEGHCSPLTEQEED